MCYGFVRLGRLVFHEANPNSVSIYVKFKTAHYREGCCGRVPPLAMWCGKSHRPHSRLVTGTRKLSPLRIMTTRSGPVRPKSPRQLSQRYCKIKLAEERDARETQPRELRPSRKSSQGDSQGSAPSHPHSSAKGFRGLCCAKIAVDQTR